MGEKGGLTKGKLHSECDDKGCGIEFNVDGTDQVVELEDAEAILVPDAFDRRCFNDSFCEKPAKYKMTGTMQQVASAINGLGGGINFDPGAKIIKNGRKMSIPRLTYRNKYKKGNTIESGSVVINRTNMLDPKEMTFEGTAYEIASAVNSYGGNGIELEPGQYLKDGGSVESKKVKRPWEVRFHLGRGKDFMKWRIENKPDKKTEFLDPETVQIHMFNCKLTNQVKTAEKIFKGEINKRPIAWIKCVDVKVSNDIVPVDPEERVSYNPRKSPNWLNEKGEILDGHIFDKLITYGRSVYYDDGEQLYKIGGLIEDDYFDNGGNVEKRYRFTAHGYVYATSDQDAKDKTEEVREQMDKASDWAHIDHLTEQPHGSRYSREVFEGGGSVMKMTKADKLAQKKAKELLNKQIKRLREFKDARLKYPGELVDIATAVHKHDDKAGEKSQREKLEKWILNPENDVKVLVAFSGGKDSVAMVLYLFEIGVKASQIELWHHLVDGKSEDLWDWSCTESYCQAFADHFGIPLLFSYREGGITREMYRECELNQDVMYQEVPGGEFKRAKSVYRKDYVSTRRKFPMVSADLTTRWCSAKAKIDVMSRSINSMDRFKTANIIVCTGERRQESTARAEYVAMEPYNLTKQGRTAITWRPIVDWLDDKVWGYMEANSIQPHPAYELGWGRCSCQICIFSSANAWATNYQISPNKVNRIAEIEKEFGSMLYNEDIKEEKWVPPHQKTDAEGKVRNYKGANKMVSTGKKKDVFQAKVNKGKSFLDEELAKRWLPELLGEFRSPIFVLDWKRPSGADSSENCGAN